MTQVEQLVQQYDQAMTGDAWHGDPVWTILDGITAECAARKAAPNSHSIWQIVLHMSFWEDVATRRMLQPVIPDLTLNFPEVKKATEANWKNALEQFRSPGGKRTFRADAVGVVHHHIYHAGQISLLKNTCSERGGTGL